MGASATITDSGTIKFTDATASAKTFAGGGKTYNNVWFSGAGTGIYNVTGANTFTGYFKTDASRDVRFTAATTTTAATWDFGISTIIGSITAASHTLAKSGGGRVQSNYLSVSRSTATPGSTFYAANSINGGNNSGWVFGAFLDCDAGAFAMSGQDAGLFAGRYLYCGPGAYVITGGNTNLWSSAGFYGVSFVEDFVNTSPVDYPIVIV
jgi:hypothetical protein